MTDGHSKSGGNYSTVPMSENFFFSRDKDGNGRDNALLQAWQSKDMDAFKALLKESEDLNNAVKDYDNLRLIDILAQNPDKESNDYLDELTNEKSIQLDHRNLNTGSAALHYAAEVGSAVALKILLDKGADVNIQDLNGNTPLFILIQRWDRKQSSYAESLEVLLNNPKIALNIPNSQGYTPIHLAAAMFEGPAEKLIEMARDKIDLDTFRDSNYNETAREALLRNFPDIQKLPGRWNHDRSSLADYRYRLFYYLTNGKELRFVKLIREAVDNNVTGILTCTDGQGYTFLQRACERGCMKSVKKLIDLGANVNHSSQETDPPIIIAIKNNQFDIVLKLLDEVQLDVSENDNLLHNLVQLSDASPRFIQCLRKLISLPDVDVNKQDKMGRTALYIAAKKAQDPCIFTLLDNGAKLDTPNSIGEMPLDFISQNTLRNYLDSKVQTNGLPPKDDSLYISLDYQFAEDETDQVYILSNQLLNRIAKSYELRNLMSHPMLSTAILLKWKRIRYLFYLYLIFYGIFCKLITLYIFLKMDSHDVINNNCSSSNFNGTCSGNLSSKHHQFFLSVEILVPIFIIVLAVTESSQLATRFSRYIRTPENWLQWAVIFSTTALIFEDWLLAETSASISAELSAITVLLIWLEFFFVLGDNPRLTFFVDIFRNVALFLLRFLLVNTALILGFAFSFHILFRNTIGPFSTMHQALFKTIIMLTGEFDIGQIPLDSYPVVSHIIFVTFVFLIAIVMFNLLIGLAVSATKTIEDNPFLHRCISQVSIISNYEDLYFSNSILSNKLFRVVGKIIRSKNRITSPVLYIFPNQKNKVKVKSRMDDFGDLTVNLPTSIMDEIYAIIANKQEAQTKKTDKIDELKEYIHEELRIMSNRLTKIIEHFKIDGGLAKQGGNR